MRGKELKRERREIKRIEEREREFWRLREAFWSKICRKDVEWRRRESSEITKEEGNMRDC